jgi:hypothetical protein
MPLRYRRYFIWFYKKLPKYNPQKTDGEPYQQKSGMRQMYIGVKIYHITKSDGKRYP